jgi:hypothetical protein
MLTVQNDPRPPNHHHSVCTILRTEKWNRSAFLTMSTFLLQSVGGLHDSQGSYSVSQTLETLKCSWRCSSYKASVVGVALFFLNLNDSRDILKFAKGYAEKSVRLHCLIFCIERKKSVVSLLFGMSPGDSFRSILKRPHLKNLRYADYKQQNSYLHLTTSLGPRVP